MDASILLGGATGLIGTALTYLIDYFKHREDKKVEIEAAKVALEIQRAELAKIEAMERAKITELTMAADATALGKSFDNDTAAYISKLPDGTPRIVIYLMGFVDFLRGFIRPGTTIGYCFLFVWLLVNAIDMLGIKAISEAKAEMLIDTAIYLSTTTLLWWFGVRPLQKGREIG